MPLPMKSVHETATELGMPESEIRALIHMNKIRAVMRKGQLAVAPDEIAKLKRLRKTLQDNGGTGAKPPAKAAPPSTTGGPAGAAKPAGATAKPAATRSSLPKPGLKLPPPPPK
jgi:hypothetical protein